jgi:hypothetical protein
MREGVRERHRGLLVLVLPVEAPDSLISALLTLSPFLICPAAMRTGRALAAAVGLLCLNAVVGGPFRQKAQATPAEPPAPVSRALAPGQCGVYKNGKAVLALCIDSAVQWGADVVQVSVGLTRRESDDMIKGLG